MHLLEIIEFEKLTLKGGKLFYCSFGKLDLAFSRSTRITEFGKFNLKVWGRGQFYSNFGKTGSCITGKTAFLSTTMRNTICAGHQQQLSFYQGWINGQLY